jgi:imidazolonepropionase-like amidohydrolase
MRGAPNVIDAFAVAAIAAMTIAGTAGAEPRPGEGTFAVVGATVHRVSAPDLEGGAVLVEKGRITAVGPLSAITLPVGVEQIDASGLHLYPGFINANSVIGLVEIQSVRGTVDMEEVGDLNPSVRAETGINPSSELIPVTRANGVLLALVAARGGLISGTSALVALDGWTWEEMTIRSPVALHVHWPSMHIDRARSTTQKKKEEEQIAERTARIRALRKAFAAGASYWRAEKARADGGAPAQKADVVWAAMQPIVERKIPVVVEADDLAQIRAALDWSAEEEVDLVIAGGRDAWQVADELAARRVPVIIGPVNRLPARQYEFYDTPFTLPARLEAAGVKVLFSTSPGGFGAANARNLPHEVGKAVAFGLSREAGIRSLTLTAAEVLGAGDRLGSIDPEKDATFFLVDGDPLEVRSDVRRAWISGREIDLMNRHRRLYDTYRARPR